MGPARRIAVCDADEPAYAADPRESEVQVATAQKGTRTRVDERVREPKTMSQSGVLRVRNRSVCPTWA